jgi:acylphosphatase
MGEKPTTDQARLHAIVHGRVQGVSFRYYTIQAAQRIGLTGWVANRRNGTVETIAEGPREALNELLAFLQKGPPLAWVERVETNWQHPTNEFNNFKVRYL